MQKFIRKPEIVEAFQFDGTRNCLPQFLEGARFHDPIGILELANARIVTGGMWVIKTGSGELMSFSHGKFMELYMPVPEKFEGLG